MTDENVQIAADGTRWALKCNCDSHPGRGHVARPLAGLASAEEIAAAQAHLPEPKVNTWYAGWTAAVDGIQFRVVPGNKKPVSGNHQDLRLEWRTADGKWRPPSFASAFLLNAFYFWSENGLYPPPQWEGGRKFLDHVHIAVAQGWEEAWRLVELDKASKQA